MFFLPLKYILKYILVYEGWNKLCFQHTVYLKYVLARKNYFLLYGMTQELANNDRNRISGELIFNVPFNLEQW